MASEIGAAMRELIEQNGISEEAAKITVENALKAAYKKTFGTADNAIVVFEDDLSDVRIYARKQVIDGVYDPVTEIELEEAREYAPSCEEGDELDILLDPKTFDRSAVTQGKQTAHQGFRDNRSNTLYNEYKDKIGEVIIGIYRHERNGNIYVNLGNVEGLEGLLPKRFQSPREEYEQDDRIKALIVDIKKTNQGIQLVLSRSDPELVRSIMEIEVPEISDRTVEIYKVVREAGYRTKIAVSSVREDVDPVGACVGLKGSRITNVIHELYGEKVDVLKYDSNPTVFIKNALSPAEVSRVIILDETKKEALAIVPDSQFSLAIGKQGQNVRLANRLCDWSIDVKTEEQAAEMDLSEVVSRQNARALFRDEEETDDIQTVAQLPGVDQNVAEALKNAGIEDIQQFIDAYEDGALDNIEGVTKEDIEKVNKIIDETVEFVEETVEETVEKGGSEAPAGDASEENNAAEEEEKYYCPNCGCEITLDMTQCPKCHAEIEFEEDEE